MSVAHNLTILSWNCHQLPLPRKLTLLQYLEDNPIDVLSLQETHGTPVKHPSYHVITPHPDLTILIRKNLRFLISYMCKDNDCIIAHLTITDLHVICTYVRDGKTASGITKLISYMSSLAQTPSSKIVMLGDINTHRNTASRRFDQFLLDSDHFDCINEDTPTFRRSYSILDRCVLSFPAFRYLVSFQVLTNSPLHSDHFPILLKLDSSNNSRHFEDSMLADKLFPIRCHSIHHKSIPQEFGDTLDALLLTSTPNDWDALKTLIIQALRSCKTIHPGFKRRVRLTLPRIILKELQSAHDAGDTHLIRQSRKEVHAFQREKWFSYVESIDFEMSPRTLWIKFNNSRGRPIIPHRFGDGAAEVNALKEQLSSFFRIEIGHPIPRPDLSPMLRELLLPFGMEELNISLNELSGNSAPGPDGLPYNVYQNFGPLAKTRLLRVYNDCLRTGKLPDNFKHAVQNALPKSDGGVRGLTLMNAVVKILERLIYNRIKNIIYAEIPDYQFGFKKNLSSIDQAAKLIVTIQQARAERCNVGLLFLDIKKAFDRVDHHLLILDLLSIGIPRYMVHLILCLISHNRVTVLLNGFTSEEYIPEDGLPQGGILSPLLFIFYMRHLPVVRTRPFALADDVALLSISPLGENPALPLSADYGRIRTYFQERRIQLSDTKVRSMFIMTNRKRFHHMYVQAHGHRVIECTTYKYLGIWIDQHLNFQRFTDHVVAELKSRINVIRRISSCVRLSRILIEKFYNSYARGYLNYVAPILPALAPHLLERIERADRHGLRLCVGALPGTRITEINQEVTLLTFPNYLKKCVLNYGARMIHHPELSHLLEYYYYREDSPLVRSWHELWEYYAVPSAPNIKTAKTQIRYRMRRPKDRWKYHRHWPWKERTLARLRMRCIPTRVWAYKLRFSPNDTCRHCQLESESWNHLFTICPALDLSLRLYWDLHFDTPLNEENLSLALHSRQDKIRRPLEDAVIKFIDNNKLFKR